MVAAMAHHCALCMCGNTHLLRSLFLRCLALPCSCPPRFAQEALQDNINRLGAALGESSFFGGGLRNS